MKEIKALKTLVRHLSREPDLGMNNLNKINEQCHMTNKSKDEQAQGRTHLWTNPDDKSCVYHCTNRILEIFSVKK